MAGRPFGVQRTVGPFLAETGEILDVPAEIVVQFVVNWTGRPLDLARHEAVVFQLRHYVDLDRMSSAVLSFSSRPFQGGTETPAFMLPYECFPGNALEYFAHELVQKRHHALLPDSTCRAGLQ